MEIIPTRRNNLEAFPGSSSIPMHAAEAAFRQRYPAFVHTSLLDDLRQREYARLDQQGHLYLDFTGGSLYAESQLRDHLDLLRRHVFGNPHSSNPTSRAMTALDEQARACVFEFFHASPDDYCVIFTPNASGALKLVGEAYPFAPGGHYLLTVDNHNSVNGIREFARARGAAITYLPIVPPDLRVEEQALSSSLELASEGSNCLFAYPAQSNFSGVQHPLEWIAAAQARGWDVLVDCASFVPTNRLDLTRWRPDFVPISFYKLFGYPTGVGCLLARKAALAKLRRPWFGGGTIWGSSVHGDGYVFAEGEVAFEDGTINYLQLPAVEIGLKHLMSIGMETIHERVMCLTGWVLEQLLSLRHGNGTPLVQVYGPCGTQRRGATIALNFLTPDGRIVDERVVEQRANQHRLSLRTGCLCNPGATEAAFRQPQAVLQRVYRHAARGSWKQFLAEVGDWDQLLTELGMQSGGVVRISLGLVTNFADVYRFLHFARTFLDDLPGEGEVLPRPHC